MQLRDVLKEIRRKKSWTQRDMAAALQIDQQDVQRAEHSGRNQEKQWQIFLKLLPFCLELDLLGARDLLPPDRHEPGTNMASGKTSEIKNGRRKKRAIGR